MQSRILARASAATSARLTVARPAVPAIAALQLHSLQTQTRHLASAPRPPRSRRAAVKPNSSSGSSSWSKRSGDADAFPTAEEMVSLSLSEVATQIYRLPMFRATSRGAARLSRSDTSSTCEGVLQPPGGFFAAIRDLFRIGFFSFDLARYVRVEMIGQTLEEYDFLMGSREALLLVADLFNTFHLESSRAQLRTLMRPHVFDALEASWKMLDAVGLRLTWRVSIRRTTIANSHIHDSDSLDDDGTGGGGLTVPIAPDVPPTGARGGRDATDAASTSATDKLTAQRAAAADSKEGDAPRAAPNKFAPVRYVDLDVQYHVVESFELWTTRPDQKVPQPADVDADEKADEETKADENATQKAKASAPSSAASAQTSSPSVATGPLVDPAVLAGEMHRRIEETDSSSASAQTPVAETTSSSSNGSAAAAAPAAAASAADPAAAAASKPASTGTGPATATPPAADYLPPLARLLRVDDIALRGFRFWSSLPAAAPEPRHWYSPNQSFISVSATRAEIEKSPVANWIIKDIVD